ncbi:SDR family NAD(P)-dependent oxidoreductase [Clavibacter michiganensis subsp. michiganensis]|uniref:SDR family NAD(P)-dependent oxidoreductase n=1 Tax=Clavibacter michiganensis TaxID=28447 RepID=UPI000B7547CA|nr:SDR family NAD(P)-dependent oxidoreductase [Clavibacter michiganensis]MDO4066433.1 SDR family NAD(P)-dependent oxidoreductase [Clavibacter michiganensis]MDO4072656.1 SDR family NAD(P)-dependent oxidoreductase [Clavibacter michiganensis]MDO4075898.1 SDR family NAD(P)-dependent oxidoreductase [Clavibacter michiganensis]MDO4090787.1 SDR family NAD(P)-dependent oxidoreductase [Clavibacter michiganensis]MDO4131560.1 SDR family NAD(P)-dependent oxidoreductase [Clavibacter michiganensis]
MTTIAIVGAGAGLGAAVARRFGAEGFAVALISRSQERVDELARTLADEGITARGYAANVRDHVALAAALDRAAQELGPVEVLQYSPLPQKEFLRPVLETTPGDLVGAFEFSIQAPVAAVHQVLQGMRVLGRGTVLFINGGTAVEPLPKYAGTSIAFAGESAYGQMIHEALAGDGIHVGQLIIPGAIIPGHEEKDPRVLADTLWSMHQERGDFRRFAADMDDE